MHLNAEGYSPALLQKIEYAGGHAPGFEQASETLQRLAEFAISPKHVQRITERLGRERAQLRDTEVEAFREDRLAPTHPEPPAVAAIHLDAGKIQVREDAGGPGVRNPQWNDTKVACFATYPRPAEDVDPQPDPPKCFTDPMKVARLSQEMERVRSLPVPAPAVPLDDAPPPAPNAEENATRHSRKPLLRTAIATMAAVEAFGWMVATEARKRGFYEAAKKAVVGDGGNWIGPLGEMHFAGWEQVLDFLHLLAHLYAAAKCAFPTAPKRAWNLYVKLLVLSWKGKVGEVISELESQRDRLGPAPSDAPKDDPRCRLARAVEYVRNNAGRMDYPRYRREGLPITSTLVESLIKQINQRMKGTEKFWTRGGAEAVLQVRAAYLSEDGRAEDFHQQRRIGRAARGGSLPQARAA